MPAGTRRGTAGDRRRALVTTGVVVVGALAAVVLVAVGQARPEMSAAGRPVTEAQFDRYIALDGPQPGDRSAVLGRIARDRVLFDLARENGVVDAPSLEAVLDRREQLNTANARAVAAGEVVYGAAQYGPREFHSRVVTSLRTEVVRAMTSATPDRLLVTDAQVAEHFAADERAWTPVATSYRYTRLRLPGAGDGARLTASLAAGESLEDVAAAVPGSDLSTPSWTAEQRSTLPVSPGTRAELQMLEPGGHTTPVTDRGGWAVLRLDGTSVDREQALAESRTRIRAVLLEQRLDSVIDERLARTADAGT